MGTMLQSAELTLDDFDGFEGCNEILNVTRPDVVCSVHRRYFEAGTDAVETNTFGANLANLAEYDIPERIFELAEAGARLAREVADEYSVAGRPRFVLGSVGPGTKLPTLGHVASPVLRDADAEQVRGLLVGGANAGLPELGPDGAVYPLGPDELAEALANFVREFGVRLVGGCCGTTDAHLRSVVDAVRSMQPVDRLAKSEPGISSLYQAVPFEQDASVLMIGERTNANGSKAFRDAMLEGRDDDCVEIARAQTRDGAHLLDLCVDYVGRDGAVDMTELAARFATASTLPIMLDSTEPAVIEAGLERLGGRGLVNSGNYEGGGGAGARDARGKPVGKEHGARGVALTIQ